jgi:hypothetical protein
MIMIWIPNLDSGIYLHPKHSGSTVEIVALIFLLVNKLHLSASLPIYTLCGSVVIGDNWKIGDYYINYTAQHK